MLPPSTNGYYIVFIELEDKNVEITAKEEKILDSVLRKYAKTYNMARDVEALQPLKILQVNPGSFRDLAKLLMDEGAPPNQIKIPRVLRRDKLIDFMLTRIKNNFQ
jgi:hypothetical protein